MSNFVDITNGAGPLHTQVLVDIINGGVGSDYINMTNTIVLAISAALVLFMLPGLAFFYSGLLRRKNAVTMLAQCFVSAAIVTAIWITFGFGAAFGPSVYGVIGDCRQYAVFRNILFNSDFSKTTLYVNTTIAAGVPFIVFWLFQLSFAIITPALVVGAFADRLKWRGYILFNILFTVFIYIPACHWLWGGGQLAQYGGLDWAGGIVIHVTCGFAAIGSVIVLGRRKILLKESTNPHSMPLVAIGAAILFFGWFGFNSGGAAYGSISPTDIKAAGAVASNLMLPITKRFALVGTEAFVNTFLGMAIGMLCWLILESIFRKGKVSFVGLVTGAVAGLATITPAAGFLTIGVSIPIIAMGAILCYGFAKLNHHTHFDDALEVWPIHGMGGVIGAIGLSLLVSAAANPDLAALPANINEAFGTKNLANIAIRPTEQYFSLGMLIMQVISVGVIAAWTLIVTLISFALIRYVFRGKLSDNEQIRGVDAVVHNEEAYGSEYNVENILNGVIDEPQLVEQGKEYKMILENVDKQLKKYKIKN